MKTFRQFQEQLERGKVTPQKILTPDQSRKRRETASKLFRNLVKSRMKSTSKPSAERHREHMKDLLSTSHVGMHG